MPWPVLSPVEWISFRVVYAEKEVMMALTLREIREIINEVEATHGGRFMEVHLVAGGKGMHPCRVLEIRARYIETTSVDVPDVTLILERY